MSWLTTEQWVWNDKRHLSPHKIPASSDVPEHSRSISGPSLTAKPMCLAARAMGEPR